MGYKFRARCLECGHRFIGSVGNGFFTILIHCDECGKEKMMSFDKFPEAHRQFVKGLDVPYSTVTMDIDSAIQKDNTIEPISEEEYHRRIGEVAGNCKCGGSFEVDAPPRCPKCHSDNYIERETTLHWD